MGYILGYIMQYNHHISVKFALPEQYCSGH